MKRIAIALDSISSSLEQGLWYNALPGALKSKLLEHLVVYELESGEALFSRGDDPSGLYSVLEGMVRISGLNEDGKEAILTFIESPNWFGEVALFDGNVRTHNAAAEGRAVVAQVPQTALDRILADEPRYWRDFGCLVASKLRLAFVALEDLALLPAPVRLARRIVLIAQGYGERQGEDLRPVSIPQEQLGKMLSISRQTTNQILKDLQARGFVDIVYGSIRVLNLDGLKEFCSFNG